MWGLELKEMNCSEIKLNFKASIESVEYPEVKTQQIKIEERNGGNLQENT